MIDDDFDKMVRRMFEQLFQTTGMFGPIGDNQIRIQSPQNRTSVDIENTAPRIEKIELGDRMIVLIDNLQQTVTPVAKVTGTDLNVTLSENQDDIFIKLPYAIDAEESSILYHNGIIEINLRRSADTTHSNDSSERILKNESRS